MLFRSEKITQDALEKLHAIAQQRDMLVRNDLASLKLLGSLWYHVAELHLPFDLWWNLMQPAVERAATNMHPSPDEIQIRPIVMLFAREIELRLRKHDADRGESWKEMRVLECLGYAARRLLKLQDVIGSSDFEETRRQAASVAAAAMFIADNFGDLRNELD